MRRVGALIVVALLLAACSSGVPVLTTSEANVSSPIAGTAQIAVAFINTGTADDELLSVSSPLAAFIEIHETVVTDGRAVMTKRESVPLSRGATVLFRPGSLHLMLLVPDATVVTGARVPLTFTFATHPPITVTADVVDLLDLVTFADSLEVGS